MLWKIGLENNEFCYIFPQMPRDTTEKRIVTIKIIQDYEGNEGNDVLHIYAFSPTLLWHAWSEFLFKFKILDS